MTNETDKKLQTENLQQKKGRVAVPFLIFLIPTALVLLVDTLYQFPKEALIGNTVMTAIGSGCIVFGLLQSLLEDSLLFNNAFHLWRFFFVYLISLIFSLLFAVLPAGGWPFLAVSVSLALFSNELLGIISSAMLIFISTCTAQTEVRTFLLYFITGIAAILLFRKMDENFKVTLPSVISLMLLFVSETAMLVIYLNENLNEAMFAVPLINIFMNSVLLVISLKYFSSAVIHKYRIRFMEIVDPEFKLMTDLKQKSRKSYYRSIHTAYFCERIANALKLDSNICKAGGYYHRLEDFDAAEDKTMLQTFAEVHHFPLPVLKLLEECSAEDTFASKEAAIVKMSDTIVHSIMYLIEKEPEKPLHYEQIIGAIFDQKFQNHAFDKCSMSFAEYNQMKRIFMEEKLYYDFLR